MINHDDYLTLGLEKDEVSRARLSFWDDASIMYLRNFGSIDINIGNHTVVIQRGDDGDWENASNAEDEIVDGLFSVSIHKWDEETLDETDILKPVIIKQETS